MTRQDYELIARVLRDTYSTAHEDCDEAIVQTDRAALAGAFADELAGTNERFDRERFLKACGVSS